jgi:Calx-beta domain
MTTEPSESVVLTLVAKSGYALGSPRSATVTIADDDAVAAATVTIVATDPAAGEPSNPGVFTVTRTGSTVAALVVSYGVSGTATAGSDYTALAGSVTIPAGSMSATITVNPLSDTLTEAAETVIVTLVSGSGYTVASPSSATVTIADAITTSTVSISATDPAAAEPADTGTFTVSRTGSTTTSLTVSYTVSGSATAGSDYTTLPGSVTIPAGAFSATITVTPIDDTAVEVDESVTVTLTAGTGYTVGLFSVATVQIADNDSGTTVTIAATDQAAEPSDTGTFTLTRTGSTTSSLTVSYTVAGTATAGTDYTTLSGSVTFAAMSTTATITVTPIDDMTAEGDETVVVTLSAASGYTVGSPGSASLTIADNDGGGGTVPTVTITATDPNAAEPSDSGTFTVARTGSTTAALTVFYTPSGTATNGTDYAALSGSMTIPAGAASAVLTVAPIDDTAHEGAETVIVTLSTNAFYTVGTPDSATVTIADND